MARLARFSAAARDWYLQEIAYLAARNPEAAKKVAARFREARRNLVEYPGIAQIGLVPGTRRLVVGAYVLTVRERGGVMEIASIRHGRQGDAYAPALEDE
jgi:plasmid stabilization system protein ParE